MHDFLYLLNFVEGKINVFKKKIYIYKQADGPPDEKLSLSFMNICNTRGFPTIYNPIDIFSLILPYCSIEVGKFKKLI